MAITFGSIGAKAEGQATIAIPYPASVGAGDLLLAGRCLWRPSTITATDEPGWTPIGDLFGGTGTATDDHTTRIRGDYLIASGGETGTVTFDTSVSDGSTTDGGIGVMARYAKGSGTWDAASQTGDDATHDNTRSVTLGTAHTVEAGDWLVALVAVDRDPALTIVGASFTGTATFGTINERASGAGSALGRDGNIAWFDVEVTGAGTCTGFTMTTETVVQCGPVNVVRLREVGGGGSTPAEGAATGSWSFTGSATGARTPKGSASGALSWAGSATGQRSPKGSGSGSYAYAGTATGTAPGVDSATGNAAGSWAYVGSATGKRAPIGTATGTLSIAGAATGITTREGSAVGAWAYVGAASGLSSELVAPAGRTLSVLGETRTLVVLGESRVLTIPTDHRTMEA